MPIDQENREVLLNIVIVHMCIYCMAIRGLVSTCVILDKEGSPFEFIKKSLLDSFILSSHLVISGFFGVIFIFTSEFSCALPKFS